MSAPKTLFSGIQPTGGIHLGNYLGALQNWVALCQSYRAIYCIVDYHALTGSIPAADLPRLSLETARILMAVGLTPDSCTMFVQSAVPQHAELAWILNTVTSMGWLERMTQFKEKAQRQESNVNVGLFAYPVLQAADILIYKAEVVPVGEDQVQHLELSREIARRFNHKFGVPFFPEPKEIVGPGARIKSLTDPQSKMSKSVPEGCLTLLEPLAGARKKILTAVTDPQRQRRTDPGNPDVCNIFTLHRHFTPPDQIREIDAGCRRAAIGCVECKNILLQRLLPALEKIQESYHGLSPETVREVLETGGTVCRRLATQTMEEVRQLIGCYHPRYA